MADFASASAVDAGKDLYAAVKAMNLELVTEIATANAQNTDVLDYFTDDTFELNTPLIKSITRNRIDITEVLLQNGANASLADTTAAKHSPLRWCATCPNEMRLATAKLLIEIGHADVNGVDYAGKTPLFDVRAGGAVSKHSEFISLLVDNGANINFTDPNGNTPLIASPKYVELFLEKGADLNAASANGNTCLHACAEKDDWNQFLAIMIEKGASIDAECSQSGVKGHTPLFLAVSRGCLKNINSLLDAGAKIDHQVDDQKTALMIACMQGHFAVVQLLLSKGANKDLVDKYGFTALQYVPAAKGTEGLPSTCWYRYKDEDATNAMKACFE